MDWMLLNPAFPPPASLEPNDSPKTCLGAFFNQGLSVYELDDID